MTSEFIPINNSVDSAGANSESYPRKTIAIESTGKKSSKKKKAEFSMCGPDLFNNSIQQINPVILPLNFGTILFQGEDSVTHYSKIGWVQCGFLDARVWIIYTGCNPVSPECKNCWAETVAERRKFNSRLPKYKEGFHKVVVHKKEFDQHIKWKNPSLVFVNSESDTFHEDVSDEVIIRIFELMNSLPEHTFQILTKRPERLLKMLHKLKLTDNIWVGVTCGHRVSLDRIEILRQIPAKVRWISAEPLLQDLCDEMNLDGIDWFVVGGEQTSPFADARPMKPEWVRKFIVKCDGLGIPLFLKQWGTVGPDGVRRQTKDNNNYLDGVKYEQFPKCLYEYYGVKKLY